MATESLLVAAAFAAGVIEGGAVLTHAASKSKESSGKSQLIIPAVLYGTLSLPLGFIGAAPGSSLISRLPCSPEIVEEKNSELPSLSQVPVQVEASRNTTETSDMSAKRGRRRVDIIREENRKNLAAARRVNNVSQLSPEQEAIKVCKKHII